MESKRINVNLNAGILEELDRQAATNGLSRSGYITHMVLKVRDTERTMGQIMKLAEMQVGEIEKLKQGGLPKMFEKVSGEIEKQSKKEKKLESDLMNLFEIGKQANMLQDSNDE